MLILAHAGITLGAAALLDLPSSKSNPHVAKQYDIEDPADGSAAFSTQSPVSASKASRLQPLVKQIDVRVLLIGSLLPDIVDKPVGLYLFRDTFGNGRIFCHTLLFLLVITIAGVYMYRRRDKVWLLVLSFGTLAHLILDQMWLTPRTLLWPLYGIRFESEDVSEWYHNLLHGLLVNPGTYVPELVGGVILAWFIWRLVRNGKVYAFLKNGRVL
jgi:inner membrane protein